MSDVMLVLGPVAFQSFEIPSGVNFGGRQIVAVHQLTDGRRVLDSMGPAEAEISFAGVFSGEDATTRARLLNSLRVTGAELTLTWDVFRYAVILAHFDAEYENSVWIPYRVKCTVVRDEATSISPYQVSLGNSVTSDLNIAADQCSGLNVDFTGSQNCLTNPNATTRGTAAYIDAQSSITATLVAISAQIGAAEAALQALDSPATDLPDSLATDLTTSAMTAAQLANLTKASAYVGRAVKNLSSAST